MSAANELELIKKAKELEETRVMLEESIKITSSKLAEKENENPPEPPKQESIPEPAMPKPKFNLIIDVLFAAVPAMILTAIDLSLLVLAGGWVAVYYIFIHKKLKKKQAEKDNFSDEYKQQCESVKDDFLKRKEEADKKYAEELKNYNEKIIPEFEQQKQEGISRLKSELEKYQNELNVLKEELERFYTENNKIPEEYRSPEILSYVCSVVENSDESIETAFRWYDERKAKSEEISQQGNNNLALGIAAAAVGVAVGSAVVKKGVEKNKEKKEREYFENIQREEKDRRDRIEREEKNRLDRIEREEKNRRDRIEREERERRSREKMEHNAMVERIRANNAERKRKGQAELPVPPYRY